MAILSRCIICELNFSHIFDDFVTCLGPGRVAHVWDFRSVCDSVAFLC